MDDDKFCPVRVWREYSCRLKVVDGDGPAFCLNEAALTRDYMVNRTTVLMMEAGISFVDNTGSPMDMKASSWRSGAVCSAVAAGISGPHIMALGRWTSQAWLNYLIQAPPDLQGAAQSMWATCSLTAPTTCLRLSDFNVGEFVVTQEAHALDTLGFIIK